MRWNMAIWNAKISNSVPWWKFILSVWFECSNRISVVAQHQRLSFFTATGNKPKWQAKQTIDFYVICANNWTRATNACQTIARRIKLGVANVSCGFQAGNMTRPWFVAFLMKNHTNPVNWKAIVAACIVAAPALASHFFHIIFNLRQFFHYANSKADVSVQ